MTFTIAPIGYSPLSFAAIQDDADADGFALVRRLGEAWLDGSERYDREGELLLGAFGENGLVGIGGISLDPYAPRVGLGRVRHVYVLRSHRGFGVGAQLMEELIAHARGTFEQLRLRTSTETGAAFYERLGFKRADANGQTHVIRL